MPRAIALVACALATLQTISAQTTRVEFKLNFSAPRDSGAGREPALPDDAPEFFTALQEQLGLKLQPEKTIVPVFVIDSIERPTEN